MGATEAWEAVDGMKASNLLDLYTEIADSDDYLPYVEFRGSLDRRIQETFPEILEQLKPEIASFIAAEETAIAVLRRRPSRLRWVALVGVCASVGIIVFSLGANIQYGLDEVSRSYPVLGIVPAFATLGLLIALINVLGLARIRAKLKQLNATLAVQIATEELVDKARTLVQEAFSRTLNEVLGPEGKLAFPTDAPRLVELGTSVVVPSASGRFLRDFIAGHASSAIGIAGPRGSGKSTLMRGLDSDPKTSLRVVPMTAPVRYEPIDFVRRLHRKVAEDVLSQVESSSTTRSPAQQRLRVFGVRITVALLVGFAGLSLILWDLLPYKPSLGEGMGAASILGVVAIGSALLVGLTAVSAARPLLASVSEKSWRIFRNPFRRLTHVALAPAPKLAPDVARTAIRRMQFDSESNSKSKNAFKLMGGLLGLEDEDSITLKDRALSHADIMNDLRALLAKYARDEYPTPIVVAIDELDKISLTEDLIDTVNDLKDLFHIDGVHFVVSVSTDALHTFEQRGLPSRDAFDSSFDTIVRVPPLTLAESLNVLSARAEGFPPIVGAFCHAWSGGLPRDLLRVARRCVEIHRDRKASSIDVFVRTVVAEDILAIIEGRLRAAATAKTSAEDRAALCALRERARSLGLHTTRTSSLEGHKRVRKDLEPKRRKRWSFLVDRNAATTPTLDPALGSIASVTSLGEALVHYFETTVVVSADKWLTPDEGVFEAAALAMAYRGEADELRLEVFQDAVRRLAG
ncbi:P-loop NTPase fold protein [Arthrobacter sp. SLBN-122]|uniref:P-loop NTPase fold protein n=1 Tax=Arthrobacter sp. SLBN-122 TaxID=2768455 RepID=UPI001153890B|nr:P-loop NTPase fold protein [Arthrobacter sp. SLBN-122]TQJ33059.1 KAP-like P-loop domain-containing protein [Arthrobacter sp. SLBN-122]